MDAYADCGIVTGDRVRRKNKAMKDKIENELKKK